MLSSRVSVSVKHWSLSRISNARYHMSETSCVVTFAIDGFLVERAYCESYCDLRIQALQRGQSVSVYLFPCRFRCIFWPISILLCFLALVYFDMYLGYVMVISVLIFSVA